MYRTGKIANQGSLFSNLEDIRWMSIIILIQNIGAQKIPSTHGNGGGEGRGLLVKCYSDSYNLSDDNVYALNQFQNVL